MEHGERFKILAPLRACDLKICCQANMKDIQYFSNHSQMYSMAPYAIKSIMTAVICTTLGDKYMTHLNMRMRMLKEKKSCC